MCIRDSHCVVYDAGFLHDKHRGAIFDNGQDTPVKIIEDSDRASPQSARAVWASMFPSASTVMVCSAWRMVAGSEQE